MTSSDHEGAASSPRAFYHPELDGLRFLAFFFVYSHHAYPVFPPIFAAGEGAVEFWRLLRESGALGVDLFFCLSGFLITRLLMLEEAQDGKIAVGRFYLRRLLRIWPLYYSFLALVVFLGYLGWDKPLGHQLWPFLFLVGNWSCAFFSFPYTTADPLWSVSLEEQFYLLWPLALRRWGARRAAACAVGMVLISIFYRILLALFEIHYPATWTLTLTRLDSLAVGILVAAFWGDQLPVLSRAWRGGLFAAGLAIWMMVVAVWPLAADPTLGAAILGYPAIAIGAGLMLMAAMVPAGRAGGLLASRPLVFLGRISYGLYVFHTLALLAIPRFFPAAEPSSWVLWGLALAFSMVLATLSYYGLERPFLLLKERFATVRSRPA